MTFTKVTHAMIKHRSAQGQIVRLLLLALSLAVLSILQGCDAQDTAQQGRPQVEQLVSVISITPSSQEQVIERSGTLRVRRIMHIHNLEEGQIKELPWYEGDLVEQNDLLVQLDADLLETALRRAQAQLDEAEQNLARLDRLIASQSVSEDALITARTRVAISQADVDELQLRIKRTSILADFDGMITARLAEPGNFAPKNTHLLTLIDPASLVIEINLSQLLLPALRLGDSVEIQVDALGQDWHPASIIRIHPSVDASSGQGTVEIGFTTLPDGIKPGQRANARLRIRSEAILLVPYSAVHQSRERNWVYLLEDGKAVERDVKPGTYWPDGVELLSGVASGDIVISRGFLGLRDGSPVTVVD